MAVLSPSTQLTSLELKFLLALLGFPNYRAPINGIQTLAKVSLAGRDRLCQQLAEKHLVDYERISTRFGLTATGRTVLNLDTSVLPITPDEKYVLMSCRDRSIPPQQIHHRVPPDQRQALISNLAAQGLLQVTKRQLGEVWLTEAGQQFLRDDCNPQGNFPVVSWTLMSHYLQFMRQSFPQSQ